MATNVFNEAFDQFIAWLYGEGTISEIQSQEMRKAFHGGFIACFNFFTIEIPKHNGVTALTQMVKLKAAIEEITKELDEGRRHHV